MRRFGMHGSGALRTPYTQHIPISTFIALFSFAKSNVSSLLCSGAEYLCNTSRVVQLTQGVTVRACCEYIHFIGQYGCHRIGMRTFKKFFNCHFRAETWKHNAKTCNNVLLCMSTGLNEGSAKDKEGS